MHNIYGKTLILYYYEKMIISARGQQCAFKKNLHFDLCPLTKESIIPCVPCELCVQYIEINT